MPQFHGITVALVSQYDACPLPEYPPPLNNDPFVDTPILFDDGKRVVTVYAPTYSSSQFWIAYQVEPEGESMVGIPYYYFKLFIDGKHIVSWGCGRRFEFKGKTMFTLYRSPEGSGTIATAMLETRTFVFGSDKQDEPVDPKKGVLEILVFRSNGRREMDPEPCEFKSTVAATFDAHLRPTKNLSQQAVRMFDTGPLMGGQPRRYFQYSLLDPVDTPFITFRYLLRSIGHLENLGIISFDIMDKPGENKIQIHGPSKLFPSFSTRSLATSIMSDTDLAKSLPFPLAIDSQKSPSPLRVPPIVSVSVERRPPHLDTTIFTNRERLGAVSYNLVEPTFNQNLLSTHLKLKSRPLIGFSEASQNPYYQASNVHDNVTLPPIPDYSNLNHRGSATRARVFHDHIFEKPSTNAMQKSNSSVQRHESNLASRNVPLEVSRNFSRPRHLHMDSRSQVNESAIAPYDLGTSQVTRMLERGISECQEEKSDTSKVWHRSSLGAVKDVLRNALNRSPKNTGNKAWK